MPPYYKEVPLNEYALDCPEGTWTGQLQHRSWGRKSNLILCFIDTHTKAKYRFSLFHNCQYKPRDKESTSKMRPRKVNVSFSPQRKQAPVTLTC